MTVRPLHDRILVKLDPLPDRVGSIIIPDKDKVPIRTGVVIAIGLGRISKKTGKRVRMGVELGERLCFHHANMQHQQGLQLKKVLGPDQALIKESDVFFCYDDENLRITL